MASIQRKIIAGLSLIILFFIAQASLFYLGDSKVGRELESTVKVNTQASSKLAEISTLAQQVRRYEKEYFIYIQNIERRTTYINEWTQTAQKIETIAKELKANQAGLLAENELAQVSKWLDALAFYQAEMKKIFAAVNIQNSQENMAQQDRAIAQTSDTKRSAAATAQPALQPLITAIEANAMITAGKDRLSNEMIKSVSELNAKKLQATLSLSSTIQGGSAQSNTLFFALVACGIVLTLVLMLKLPKAISQPIEELSSSVDALSKGELSQPLPKSNIAEFETLTKALERLRIAQQLLVQRLRATQAKT